jgi:hypothetical protein
MTDDMRSLGRMCMTSRSAAACILILLGECINPQPAVADIYMATPSNYLALLRKLHPGDTLALSPGRYLEGLPIHHINGTAGNAIVIRGRRDAITTLVARPDANTISIVNSSYVEVRDLLLDGDGQFVDGIKAEGHSSWAHHITLDGLTILRHGADQQLVGISTKCPAWGWVVSNNIIVGAGTGMYLGNSDGRAPFVAGIIEHNLIVDTVGYNLQIKQQNERPKITGMPEERNVTIIRHNVFSKSANSSSGVMARPNLLVGHWPPSGAGHEDTYAIYGNFFYQNPSEALFQGEGNLAFYGNVLVNALGDAINIQPHFAIPRRIDVFHNTVLAANRGIRVAGGDPAFMQNVLANAVFANTPIIGGKQHANITGAFVEAAQYLAEPFAPLGRLDLSPKSGRLLTPAFESLQHDLLPDLSRDFDGSVYLGPMAGAYARQGALWPLLIERKH